MVTTRRSTRLQEKQVAASAPSSPTPSNAQASPSTRRSRSATKATPPSSTRQRKATPTKSTGSGTRRGRPRKSTGSESDEAVAAQSDASSEPQEIASIVDEGEPAVQKQLFTDDAHHDTLAKDEASEPEAIEQVEEVAEVVETTAEVSEADEVQVVAERTTAVKVEEEPEPDSETSEEQVAVEEVPDEPNAAEAGDDVVQGSKPDEEEEEIVMMDSSDDEEEGDEEVAEKQTTEEASGDEDDEDIDVAAFAKMAATGIDFSSATKTQREPPPSSALSAKLVPDTLDSGASSRTKYLDFEGSKLGLGAKIVAQTASLEEQKVLGQQLSKIEKAKRQRAESTNVSTAGRKWFDMASHDLDADARRDFALLKMRNYLDPKKFYKTSDHTKKMPKHFQFGTVIEGVHEFKSARLTKKERKQTFTEEIMADEGIRSYTKRVFLQVQDKRAGGHGKKKKQKRF